MSVERELEALFRAEQAVSPAADAVHMGWQRLAVDLAVNVAPLPVGAGALKLSVWLVPKWLVVGFAVGLVGAGTTQVLVDQTPQRAEVSAAAAASSPPAVSTQLALPLSSSAEERPPPLAASGASAPSREAAAIPARSSAAIGATFDAELELISLAKGELDAHRSRRAQAWLTEHEQRFPGGVFAVEREALAVLIRCQEGPQEPALARAFAKRHPGSPLASRLEHSCGVTADSSNSANGAAALGEPMGEPSRGDRR